MWFKIRTLIKQLFTKFHRLTKLPQISHIHKNHNFSSIIGRFYTNCFYPTNFMAGTCEKYLLFIIFASCEPLKPFHYRGIGISRGHYLSQFLLCPSYIHRNQKFDYLGLVADKYSSRIIHFVFDSVPEALSSYIIFA